MWCGGVDLFINIANESEFCLNIEKKFSFFFANLG